MVLFSNPKRKNLEKSKISFTNFSFSAQFRAHRPWQSLLQTLNHLSVMKRNREIETVNHIIFIILNVYKKLKNICLFTSHRNTATDVNFITSNEQLISTCWKNYIVSNIFVFFFFWFLLLFLSLYSAQTRTYTHSYIFFHSFAWVDFYCFFSCRYVCVCVRVWMIVRGATAYIGTFKHATFFSLHCNGKIIVYIFAKQQKNV